jgi:rod shape-determining protein MreC
MGHDRDDFLISIRSTFLKKDNKQKFSLFTLILISIILLISSNYNLKYLNYVKSGINEVIYRLSKVASAPEKNLSYLFSQAEDHLNVYSKLEVLENELKNRKSEATSLEILKFENIKLKQQLDDYLVSDILIFAKVIVDKKSPFLKSVIINKGSRDGLKLGMSILDQDYLAGKIIEVNYSTSRVLLLSDINSNIPVTISPNYVQANVTGSGALSGKINFLPKKFFSKIKSGSIVYTSGTANIFKSGIPVGRVKDFDPNSSKEIQIDFFSDFSQLQYVSVRSFIEKDIKSAFISNVQNTNTDDIGADENFILSQLDEKLQKLLTEKKIYEDLRTQIEIENNNLKQDLNRLQNENFNFKKKTKDQEKLIENQAKALDAKKVDAKKIEFLELNLLYGQKCANNIKNIFKKSFKVGSPEYRACVLNKGKK